MNHIEFSELLRVFDGHADAWLSERAQEHMSGCPACRDAHESVFALFQHMRSANEAVPQATTARLLNIYQRRPMNDAPAVRQRPPMLVFDDWTSLVFERHGGIDSRQLLYRVGEYEIDLRLEFVENMCSLSGQVLPDTGKVAVTLSDDAGSVSATVTDLGEFEFSPVVQGTYRLRIAIDGDVVDLDNIPLRQ